MKKGRCMKDQIVYGLVTVSDKGQISIPVNIRRELNLESGDKLFIIKRKDNAGFAFVKLEMMDGLMDKIRSDEKFFEKIK
jgi:AbrB family looped-hinge helix DNA binding protein